MGRFGPPEKIIEKGLTNTVLYAILKSRKGRGGQLHLQEEGESYATDDYIDSEEDNDSVHCKKQKPPLCQETVTALNT